MVNVPLERYAVPIVSEETVQLIASRFDLPFPVSVERLPDVGINNAIFALGENLILRVARNDPDIFASVRKEALVVPLVRQLGVCTPELRAFDDTLELLPTPFGVFNRAIGQTLGLLNLPPSSAANVWQEVGRNVARLHAGIEDKGAVAALPVASVESANPEDLDIAGYFTWSEAQWFTAWLERLDDLSGSSGARRFVHADLQATNVIVSYRLGEGAASFVALLDWGASGWGDPAGDLAGVPTRALPYVVDGYNEVAGIDECLAARVMACHIRATLASAMRRPRPGQSWAERPLSRLIDLFRFGLEQQSGAWRSLTPMLQTSTLPDEFEWIL